MKKTLYTLNIDNYAPEITALTMPLMERWTKKIGADFYIIKDRKFDPKLPPVYEKFQIYKLSAEHKNDWNMFFDADTLIHPDFWDVTELLTKDYTCSNGSDFTLIRFKADKYFRRDGRFIGKGNWFLIASDWCTDIWEPLSDITVEEAIKNIFPTAQESGTVIKNTHLIDDYIVSRNIAKYGLKHVLLPELEQARRVTESGLLWHEYRIPIDQKKVFMQRQLMTWAVQVVFVNGNVKVEGHNMQNIVGRLGAWDGSVGWDEYLSALPTGKYIADIIESWGVKI